MGAGSKAELKASESVQILTEKEKHSGLFPLWIFDGALIIDAPTVMINRDILVSNLDEGYETYVHIGLDERKELKKDVFHCNSMSNSIKILYTQKNNHLF